MEASSTRSVFLQFLLFVDRRPASNEKIRQIRQYLDKKQGSSTVGLQVIDVGEQPSLVEHFRLVATPALVKIYPEPQQIFTGENFLSQLDTWWPRWQQVLTGVPSILPDGDDDGELREGQTALSPQTTIAYTRELIQLSDELFRTQREKENLEAQLRFKDRLISMLAHDLRNPLTALSIALETLEMGNNVDAEVQRKLKPELQAQLLKHARTQTNAINRMITDILQAARGSDRKFQIRPVELNLAHLFRDTLDCLGSQFNAKSLRIKTDIPQDLPQVYADPDRVRQLLMNLLDNAAKYTPEGGRINITALHRTTQSIQVSICDSGPGIPKENQERIFEDQFRLERDEDTEGYGIGLSLCQRIVRAHYGQIWVDSAIGQGSCFHFTLPVSSAWFD
ncbi:MAG: histidine kinase [Leptolyngbyaceae bacterium]|nr:histidine kinase [Leptolyngbyaceae bacterium]